MTRWSACRLYVGPARQVFSRQDDLERHDNVCRVTGGQNRRRIYLAQESNSRKSFEPTQALRGSRRPQVLSCANASTRGLAVATGDMTRDQARPTTTVK